MSGLPPVVDLLAADIDADGDLYLAVASEGSPAVVFIENLDGRGTSWGLVVVDNLLTHANSLAAADIDHDGDWRG